MLIEYLQAVAVVLALGVLRFGVPAVLTLLLGHIAPRLTAARS